MRFRIYSSKHPKTQLSTTKMSFQNYVRTDMLLNVYRFISIKTAVSETVWNKKCLTFNNSIANFYEIRKNTSYILQTVGSTPLLPFGYVSDLKLKVLENLLANLSQSQSLSYDHTLVVKI